MANDTEEDRIRQVLSEAEGESEQRRFLANTTR